MPSADGSCPLGNRTKSLRLKSIIPLDPGGCIRNLSLSDSLEINLRLRVKSPDQPQSSFEKTCKRHKPRKYRELGREWITPPMIMPMNKSMPGNRCRLGTPHDVATASEAERYYGAWPTAPSAAHGASRKFRLGGFYPHKKSDRRYSAAF